MISNYRNALMSDNLMSHTYLRLNHVYKVIYFLTHMSIFLEKVIRLSDGSGSYEGRIEVFVNDEWGSVCDDWFGNREATVACKYLGFLGAARILSAEDFGEGEGPIWLDDVNCDGTEYSPFHCRHNKLGRHNCGHSEDVGVRCTSELTIIP